MFLTEKHRVVPFFPSSFNHHLPLSDPFSAALSSRLLSLLPIPASNSASEILPWLSCACELLSLTISDATSLLLHQNHHSYLDHSSFIDSTSLYLLDSCNSVFACSESLLRRLLFACFSLKSHKTVIAEKKPLPQLSTVRVPSSMEKLPHGKIDPVQNAIYAVNTISALVIGAIWVTLSGTSKAEEYLKGLKVNAEIFAWGKEFNKVLEAASTRIGEGSVDVEVEKLETMIANPTAEMDLNGEMERTCEEMREGLEKLNGSVNAVFQAALCARNTLVQNLMAGAQKKC